MKLIPLEKRSLGVVAHAIVDDEDFEVLSQHVWRLNYHGYASRPIRVDGKLDWVLMHRELLGLVKHDGRQVDHFNHEKLDNRRANLRVLTAAQHAQNQLPKGISSYRGVSFHKASGLWHARIKLDGRVISLGYFRNEHVAGARAAAARAAHMPFSLEAAA